MGRMVARRAARLPQGKSIDKFGTVVGDWFPSKPWHLPLWTRVQPGFFDLCDTSNHRSTQAGASGVFGPYWRSVPGQI